MLTVIIYIPKWESFQNEWFQSLQWLQTKYEHTTIFDGSQSASFLPKEQVIATKISEGPIFHISKLLPKTLLAKYHLFSL